jgi:hypothetical protein
MKIEDIKVGMKVKIPTTKQGSHNFCSAVMRRAAEERQDFLFVIRIKGNTIVLSNIDDETKGGDHFLASDITPYSKVFTEKPARGTKVRIVSDLEQRQYMNGIACVPDMLGYMGKIATVTGHNSKGVYLDIDSHSWSWAADMLESLELDIIKYKCIKEFPGSKVGDEVEFVEALGHDYYLPEFFTPIYENPIPEIEFQGYPLQFNDDGVKWGCKSFSKEEIKSVIDFVKVFNKKDLKIGLKYTQDNFDEINVGELEQLYKAL